MKSFDQKNSIIFMEVDKQVDGKKRRIQWNNKKTGKKE